MGNFEGKTEMNMHVPQSVVSMNEIAELACVPSQIISPRECSPILSIEQDVALGVYRMTKKHVMLSEKQLFNMLCNNSMFTGTIPRPLVEQGPIKKWSGRQLLSTIIPKNINIEMANSSYDEDKPDKDENFVRIQNGEILGGVIDKTVYQSRTKGLVHSIFNEYDQFTAAKFFDNTQQLVCDWLVQSGFSVGISDLIVDDKTNEAMKTEIQKMKQQVYDIINDIHNNRFENTSIKNNMDYFEDKVNGILSKATDEAGKIGMSKVNDLHNRMLNMIKSKSKGKITNVGQMIACLGQNSDEGKRIPYGFENRTLPHFTKYDDGPESRGFVENSFISGLTPHEFFFHAIGGRGGLIDTAVKSVTGDTKIVIIENNHPKYVSIGEWIDQHIQHSEEDVEYFEEKNMELLYLKNKTFIPTTDAHGNVSWGEVSAITRHDLGNHLYKIKTLAGKTVIVPESKSLLVWNDETKSFAEKLTPEVQIGDYMPVTQKLCNAPITIEYVDMNNYLPKTEYVYGTDFNIAKHAMAEEMQGRNRIPSGWWAENNGTTFTLPYVSKARFTRTIKRSSIENIKDGCIYPYHASREHGYIADKFQLTRDNGVFIGLYLAEGNTCMTAGRVTITNNDVSVKQFVKSWFVKQGIAINEHTKTNKIGGTSSGVDGYSLLLARFLNDFVGSGARNKYVPDVAFVAPEEFIIGLLNGYFSGDGTISKNSVECGSASARLTEGISMLCTRIGVFGKVFTTQTKSNNVGTENIAPSHRLAIRAQWASQFANKVELIMKSKNEQLQSLKCSDVHRNFPTQNDVVLDAITSIELVDMSQYPKLYDLTVPSTMNFGLANGLHVYDTSDTGYLQRKLVKAMEDCKINYDYTVRNASGSIIQFLYGEDGMDATKIETQPLPFVKMDYSKLKKTYLLTEDDVLTNVLDADIVESLYKTKNWQEKFAEHFQEIMADREFVMKNILEKEQGTSIMYPVSFDRITRNAKAMFNKYDGGILSDLDPMYVLDTINKLCEELYVSKQNKGNKFLKMLIRCYLSPKKVIFDYKYNKIAFDYVINQVKQRFYDSIAHPSDMVGVVAAQSIGEPAPQMSASKDTIIRIVGENGYSFSGTVGEFIDNLLTEQPSKVVTIGEDSVVMDMEKQFKIIGVSNDEKTSWRTISQVSRHPANGGLVKVYTKSGKTTTATLTHSFLKRTEDGISEVKGSDLKIGNRIPVAKQIPEVENSIKSMTIGSFNVKLDKDFGWFVGAYLADGRVDGNSIKITKIEQIFKDNTERVAKMFGTTATTNERIGEYGPSHTTSFAHKGLAQFLTNNFGCGSYKKYIGSFVYGCSKEFISGILSGYFDGDGNTSAEKQMIRCGSRSEKLIDDICVLLAYCGIFASKLQEVTKRQPGKVMHTLCISKKYADVFAKEIGFNVEQKALGLQSIIEYNANAEERNTLREEIDMIPELGALIADIGKQLKLPGQSRTYGRWLKKEAIGRRTLGKYIEIFSKANSSIKNQEVADKIQKLIQAYVGDVVWDEIVELEYLDDPKEYVYDFTVPGNDSFMVDTGVLVHNTLNTFHLSGVASASKAVRGVPRMKELMSVTKNIKTPAMNIFLKDGYNTDDKKSTEVLNNIQTTYFRDIVKSTKVYYDPDDFNTTVEEDRLFIETYKELMQEGLMQKAKLYPWLLRFEFDRSAMLERDITMLDVYNVINEMYEDKVHVMFSDDSSKNLVFRMKIEEGDEDNDIITVIKALERSMLENLIIKGVSKITKVVKIPNNVSKYDPMTMSIESKKEWMLETAGTNLLDVLGLKEVDAIRTVSNDVNEIYELFGVEAARQALYNELHSVISDAGLYVNYRHIALLVDTMTNKGYLLSIDRHGINRADIGPFAKCSFEETTDMLIKAGIFAEVDRINGVSANIMLGQIAPAGTGDTEVLIDEWKLQEASTNQKAVQDDITFAYETFEDLNNSVEFQDDSALDNLNFDFSLPSIDE